MYGNNWNKIAEHLSLAKYEGNHVRGRWYSLQKVKRRELNPIRGKVKRLRLLFDRGGTPSLKMARDSRE
jgi:hypothetical protein